MRAWQWCVGVGGRLLHFAHLTTLCCQQAPGIDVWVEAGGREAGGGGDLDFDTGGVMVFTGSESAGNVDRDPYDDLGDLKVAAAATSSGSGPSMSSDSEKCG